jgi:predicted PurR-regulated permease PerM
MLKSYATLIFITFCEVSIGLNIMKLLGVYNGGYILVISIITAIVDILPVLGTGTILIPWGIIMLIQKEFYLGFGLLILFLAISLIRQVAEPKVLGKSLGLHPLLALFATYVGFTLFGLLGMILAPIVALLGKRLLFSQITIRQ